MAALDRLRRRAPRLVLGALQQLGDALSSRLERWVGTPAPARWSAPPAAARTVPQPAAPAIAWREHASSHAAKWIARVRDPGDHDPAEHTRRMRVAIRRVRALARVLAAPEVPPADRSLRKLGRRLGEVRDLDLAIEHTAAARALATTPLQHAALEELEAWLARHRGEAIVRASGGHDLAQLDVELAAFAAAVAALVDDEPRARGLADAVMGELAQQLAGALVDAIDEAELERLHELLARARDLQRAIGSHRDAAMWHVRLCERIARAEARGHITFARGLAEAVPSAAAERARTFESVAPAIALVHAALLRGAGQARA